MTEGLATERWINEGGRLAPEAVIERERRASGDGRRRSRARPRVLIAGAGVAGVEALQALRAVAGDRVEITVVAPELRFVDRSMAAAQPFSPQRVRGVRLQDVATEHGARWHRGALDRVEHERRIVVTRAGEGLGYDMLVLALGARPEREWHTDGVLTFHDGRDAPTYRLLLHQLREGRVNRLAFVKPTGPSWPLPLYDLALMTAATVHRRPDLELSLITPEEAPLGMFGAPASADVATLLADHGVDVRTSSIGVPGRPGWLDIRPGDRRIPVDRIVTEPRLAGPRVRGIPCVRDGFIPTDFHGRVSGFDDVYAAGDATAFPIKHGSLAAQQADAVAHAIAASAGVDVDPQPFRPVLRGALLTGASPRYLSADISGCAGDDSTISTQAPRRPRNQAGRRTRIAERPLEGSVT